jgi:hypothetical protein
MDPFEIAAIIIGVIVLVVGIVASLLAVFDGSANKVAADAAQTAVEAAIVVKKEATKAEIIELATAKGLKLDSSVIDDIANQYTAAGLAPASPLSIAPINNFGTRKPVRKSSKRRRRNSLF